MDIFHGMQGTKQDGLQCNKITNLVLSYLGLVNHVIDHALYTYQTKSENYVLVVECFTDDFMCE